MLYNEYKKMYINCLVNQVGNDLEELNFERWLQVGMEIQMYDITKTSHKWLSGNV